MPLPSIASLRRPVVVAPLLFMAVASLVLLAGFGCESRTSPAAARPAVVDTPKQPGEPLVRVRIERSADSITFRGPTKLQISPAGRPTDKVLVATPITLKLSAGQWTGGNLPAPMTADTALDIEPLGPSPLDIGSAKYPGSIQLVPTRRFDRTSVADRFDIVNHVRLEAYLPGVLDKELYDYWKPATFLAQAIAARTYTIDRIIDDGPGRHFDLEAGQQSQAYVGVSGNSLAHRAAADSMGLVLTDHGRIFTAFYASCCGGVPQSPRQAYGVDRSVPALEPQTECTWCRGTRYRDWGPIERDARQLTQRFAAWGRYHRISIANVQLIRSIEPMESHLGRPTRFVIADAAGKTYALRGDSLRSAANFSSKSMGVDPPKSKLPSGFVKVAVEDHTVRFYDGHGFGHGIGLCQYGAEGMAKAGYDPTQILAFYYPGAKIERAY